MKVKIVDKKEDVKEMTIEELAGHKYIGVMSRAGDRQKYIYYGSCKGHIFMFPPNGGAYGWSDSKDACLRQMSRDEIHVFDNACELYLWMAE